MSNEQHHTHYWRIEWFWRFNCASVSATPAVRFARLDVVDRYWRRQLTALPFRARQSSRNRQARLGRSLWEDPLPASLVEGGDAMQPRPSPAAQPLPSERTHL